MAHEQIVSLRLPRNMLGQILDGLEVLASDWEHTRECASFGMCEIEGDRHVRECSDAHEAGRIAAFYREIIDVIERQRHSSE